MAKQGNKSNTIRVTISLSEQQVDYLDQIAESGLIGQNRADVAQRFVDDAVMKAFENPLFQLKQRPKAKHR